MKIGIVTLIGMDNHGNRLQNYALEKILKSMGNNVDTIFPCKQTNKLKRIASHFLVIDGFLKLRPIKDICRERNFRKFSKLNSFSMQYGNNGKIQSLLNEEYDLFIVGSDQVWNPYFWNRRNDVDQENFLLSFAEPSKRIAYAASMGIETLPEEVQSVFIEELKQYKAISVREEAAKEYLESIISQKVSLVLDPTMLIDAHDWKALEDNYYPKQKYICVYSLGEISDKNKEKLNSLASKNGLQIVDILGTKYYKRGPVSFLTLIDHSEFVFTDSFHAVVFSILFHKPFMLIDRTHSKGIEMGSRLRGLLRQLDINENVSVRSLDQLNNLDYSKIESALKQRRDESISFLMSVLQNE